MALNINDELRLISTILNSHGIQYALCGGLAVAVHGFPRATQDIDFLVQEDNLRQIISLLEENGYNIPAGRIPFDAGLDTEMILYRISRISGEELLTVDLVIVSPVLEDVWETRETYQVDDYELCVISLKGLRKMKSLAGRPQDLADLDHLNEIE